MAAVTTLPESPQKKYLKRIVDCLFYLGTGDCWYEERKLSRKKTIMLKLWFVISNMYNIVFVLNQYAAYIRTDLTPKESNEHTQYVLAHTVVMVKISLFQIQKKRIKVALQKFFEKNNEYSCLEIENESLKWATTYILSFSLSVFFTVFFTLIDAVVAHFRLGVPLQTEIVYFPDAMYSRNLLFVKIFRFFVEVHWWFIANMVNLIDCLSITSLIFLKYKYMNLIKYFKGLKQIFENPKKRKSEMEREYEEKFVIGIQLHDDVLRCASNIQYALGNIYSTQVVESMSLTVMCLIRLVTAERELSFLLANLMYILCMANLTGVYMMAGGGITYEAAQLPQAIFESGWHLSSSKRVRTLAVVATIRGQVPVYMTAFGIITLSYANFILVMRHTYSFFAVMY